MKIPVKVIICYLITVVVLFFLANTVLEGKVRETTEQQIRNEMSDRAVGLADRYIVRFYDSKYTLRQMRDQVMMLSDILGQRIWIA